MPTRSEYENSRKEELVEIAEERGLQVGGMNKDEVIDHLVRFDAGEIDVRTQDNIEDFGEYSPTEEQRREDLLMGLGVAQQAVESQKAIAQGNPQYNPAIEYLQEEIDAIKNAAD